MGKPRMKENRMTKHTDAKKNAKQQRTDENKKRRMAVRNRRLAKQRESREKLIQAIEDYGVPGHEIPKTSRRRMRNMLQDLSRATAA